jgi:hypothetical protein
VGRVYLVPTVSAIWLFGDYCDWSEGQTMRIFRWVLLIVDVIGLLLSWTGIVASPGVAGVVVGLVFIAMFLANIIFIAITWRWRDERKGIGRVTGVFD